MRTHFFIKTNDTSRYVGMFPLEEIRAGLENGDLNVNWLVAVNSDGSSYNQFRKKGPGNWVSLSELPTTCSDVESSPGTWPPQPRAAPEAAAIPESIGGWLICQPSG